VGAPRQLPSIADADFERMLASRLELCSTIYDFRADPNTELRMAKRTALADLVSFFETDPDAPRLNSKFQRAVYVMVCRNIFRAGAQIPKPVDIALSAMEPAWGHLSFCYRLLSLLLGTFPDAEFVNFYVFKKALYLTQATDQNERTCATSFLNQYFDVREAERFQCLQAVRDFLLSFLEVRPLPASVGPLLLFLTHIATDRLAQFRGMLTAVVLKAVLPLVRSLQISVFLADLKEFLVQIADAIPDLRIHILALLQQYWPRTCPGKAHCFMELVFALVIRMTRGQFAEIAEPFFAFIVYHLQSSTFMVAATTLTILLAEESSAFVHANWRLIKDLYDVVVELEANALHVDVKAKAKAMIEKLRPFHREGEEKTAREKAQDAGERAVSSWHKVIKACKWPSPAEEGKKIAEVQAIFGRPNDTPVTFIPKHILCQTRKPSATSLPRTTMGVHKSPPLARVRDARSADF
jgi:hypothetical protein